MKALVAAVLVAPVAAVLVASGRPTRALSGILLPSLRRFSIGLPPRFQDVIAVDLTLRHLYVDAMAGSGAYNVWSAPTPVPAVRSG